MKYLLTAIAVLVLITTTQPSAWALDCTAKTLNGCSCTSSIANSCFTTPDFGIARCEGETGTVTCMDGSDGDCGCEVDIQSSPDPIEQDPIRPYRSFSG